MLTWLKDLLTTPQGNALKQLLALMPSLNLFRDQLIAIKRDIETEDVMRLVNFFSLTSVQHDNISQLSSIQAILASSRRREHRIVAEQLGNLITHIKNGGRSEYGMNRTARGEPVTPDKVFLGNIYGFWTKTVTYIRSQPQEDGGQLGMPYRKTMNWQASHFMEGYWPMIEIVGRLNQMMGM